MVRQLCKIVPRSVSTEFSEHHRSAGAVRPKIVSNSVCRFDQPHTDRREFTDRKVVISESLHGELEDELLQQARECLSLTQSHRKKQPDASSKQPGHGSARTPTTAVLRDESSHRAESRKNASGKAKVQLVLSRRCVRVLKALQSIGSPPGKLVEQVLWGDSRFRDAAAILRISREERQ